MSLLAHILSGARRPTRRAAATVAYQYARYGGLGGVGRQLRRPVKSHEQISHTMTRAPEGLMQEKDIIATSG